MSTTKRMSLTCLAAIMLAAGLLALAIQLSVEFARAHNDITSAAAFLSAQEARDEDRRVLWTRVGDATRRLERGGVVAPVTWQRLHEDLGRFNRARAAAIPATLPAETRRAVKRAHVMSARFAITTRRLINVARHDPASISLAMPSSILALQELEEAAAVARQRLRTHVNATAAGTEYLGRWWLALLLSTASMLLMLLISLATWLQREVLVPTAEAAQALNRLAAGQEEVVAGGCARDDELGRRARGRVAFVDPIGEQKAAAKCTAHLAHHDALTGLPNRLLFERCLEEALTACQQSGGQVALFVLDIDGFKSVNDVLGHAQGDALLRRVAGILTGCCGATDTVARLGDDEFAIVQSGQPQPHAAGLLSERIRMAIGLLDESPGSMDIDVSLGVAIYPDNGLDASQMRRNAEMALFRAKSGGKGSVRFCDAAMDADVRLRRQLVLDLGHAIDRQQLHLVYQPIASARTGDTLGFEALMRWDHPEFGLVPPDQFIPLAEESGSIAELGYWALQTACADAARWPRPLNIAVNLSATQFRLSDLADQVRRTLCVTGLHPMRLELEITESTLLRDREHVSKVLRDISSLGVRIVLDDFGTGYSSLSNLQSFSFDKIKIDRSFVAALEAEEAALPIIRSIIGLGRSLELHVVAEGVETSGQRNILLREGCNELQGYLIGRPQVSGCIAAALSGATARARVA